MLLTIVMALLSLLLPTPLPPVIYLITGCTEGQLDRALARAVDGGVIRFACDGRIFVAHTKILSKN